MEKIIKELTRAFDALNIEYFEGKLPKAVITIQAYNRISNNGWFYENKWINDDGKLFHELNMNAEYLNRGTLSVMTTLQHELIHLYCYENSITETSRSKRYHNIKYKEEAEKRGLIATRSEKYGWSITEPSPEFEEFINELNIKDIFNLRRTKDDSTPPTLSQH